MPMRDLGKGREPELCPSPWAELPSSSTETGRDAGRGSVLRGTGTLLPVPWNRDLVDPLFTLGRESSMKSKCILFPTLTTVSWAVGCVPKPFPSYP